MIYLFKILKELTVIRAGDLLEVSLMFTIRGTAWSFKGVAACWNEEPGFLRTDSYRIRMNCLRVLSAAFKRPLFHAAVY